MVKHPVKFGTTSSKKALMLSAAGWGVTLVLPVTIGLEGYVFLLHLSHVHIGVRCTPKTVGVHQS